MHQGKLQRGAPLRPATQAVELRLREAGWVMLVELASFNIFVKYAENSDYAAAR